MNNLAHVAQQISVWQRKGLEVGLATVIRTWGSAPCPVGSIMAVNEKGGFAGNVSGGCVETQVVSETLEIIREGGFDILDYGVSEAVANKEGLACGGEIEIFVEKLMKDLIGIFPKKTPYVRIIDLQSGAWSLIHEQRANGDLVLSANMKALALAAIKSTKSFKKTINSRRYFFQTTNPTWKLVIVGAVRIAQALIPMALEVGFRVIIVDPRPLFISHERFPGIKIICDWPDKAFKEIELDKSTAVVTLIHDNKPDDMAISLALSSEAFYIGALGSKKSHSRRVTRLKNTGVSDKDIKRIRAPVGIDIGALSPEEIAVSILAELIESKNFC